MKADVYFVYGHHVMGVKSCDFRLKKHHKMTHGSGVCPHTKVSYGCSNGMGETGVTSHFFPGGDNVTANITILNASRHMKLVLLNFC